MSDSGVPSASAIAVARRVFPVPGSPLMSSGRSRARAHRTADSREGSVRYREVPENAGRGMRRWDVWLARALVETPLSSFALHGFVFFAQDPSHLRRIRDGRIRGGALGHRRASFRG